MRAAAAVVVTVVLVLLATAAVVSRLPVDRSDSVVCGALAPPELFLAQSRTVVVGVASSPPGPVWGVVRSNRWVVTGTVLRGTPPDGGLVGSSRATACGYPPPQPGVAVVAARQAGDDRPEAFGCAGLRPARLQEYGGAGLVRDVTRACDAVPAP